MNLAKDIKSGNKLIDYYLSKIPPNINSMILDHVSQQEVKKTISELSNKSSSEHNNISNIMLKSLNENITYPLTLLFNQYFSTGSLPDIMKVVEVIPLYKNKVIDHLITIGLYHY